MTNVVVKLIELYQRTLSPDHGPLNIFYPNGFCRFHPSCSAYAKEALIKHGFFKGAALSVGRILKCNPFSQAGPDPVPQK